MIIKVDKLFKSMTEKLNSKLTKKTVGKVVESFNSFLKIPDVMENMLI